MFRVFYYLLFIIIIIVLLNNAKIIQTNAEDNFFKI